MACEQPPVDGPELTVYQIDAAQGCWRQCQGDALAPVPAGEQCEDELCSVTSGYDSLLVVAQYDLILQQQAVGPAVLQLLFDETAVDAAKLSRPVDPVDGLSSRAAVFETRVPASSATSLRLLVGHEQFLTSSSSLTSAAPSFTPRFVGCEGECSFAAGIGDATLELTPPRVLGATTLTVRQTVDGVALPERSFDYDPNDELPMQLALAVPNAAFSQWRVDVRIGQFVSEPVLASLEPVAPLELTVSEQSSCDVVDFDAELPRAVRGEWDDGCRRYNVLVRAAVRPSGPVTVTTTSGVLGTGGSSRELTLDESGCGVVSMVLPEPSMAASTVTLAAEAAGFPNAVREWSFEPTPVVAGELFGPGGSVLVGAMGTPAVKVTGNLIAPGDATLGRNRRAPLHVALEDASAPLPCGAPLPEENVECDMELIKGGGKGGCQASDSSVSVDASGGFVLNLASSVCFAGELVVELWDVRIPEPEPGQCMKDLLPLDASPELLDVVTIDYVVE